MIKTKMTVAVIAVLALPLLAACNSKTTGTSAPPTTKAAHAAVSKASPKAKKTPTTAEKTTPAAKVGTLPIQNGDWRLDSVRISNSLGDLWATARVTYTGKDSNGGDNLFTLTVFKGGKVIATLDGSANSVMPGTAVSVQFLGTDAFVAGPYTYDFQNDL